MKYDSDKKIEFPDFTLECFTDLNLIVEKTKPNQKLPKYGFRAESANVSAMIYGNSEPDDHTPLDFKFGAGKY